MKNSGNSTKCDPLPPIAKLLTDGTRRVDSNERRKRVLIHKAYPPVVFGCFVNLSLVSIIDVGDGLY